MSLITLCRMATWLLLLLAARIDAKSYRLPHILTLPAAGIAIISEGYFGIGWPVALSGAILGFICMKGAQLVVRFRTNKEGIGSGDALLMLSAGALTGTNVFWGIALGALSSAAWMRLQKKQRVPFGPFLVIGSLVVFGIGKF